MQGVLVGIRTRKWAAVLLPFVVGLLGTFFNLKNPSGSWGPVLVSLYYIPIVIAARILGTLAALVVALAAGVAHALAAFGSGQSWLEPIRPDGTVLRRPHCRWPCTTACGSCSNDPP